VNTFRNRGVVLNKYHLDNDIKEDEMGGKREMHTKY
jgi:hypothetical protein